MEKEEDETALTITYSDAISAETNRNDMGGSLGRDTAITNSISRCFRGLFSAPGFYSKVICQLSETAIYEETLAKLRYPRPLLCQLQQNEYLLALFKEQCCMNASDFVFKILIDSKAE